MNISQESDAAPLAGHPSDDQSRARIGRAAWSILRALFNNDADGDLLVGMLQALGKVLPFDRATVLRVRDGGFVCAAALPAGRSDLVLPMGELLKTVLLGQVHALDPDRNTDWADLPMDLVEPAHAALIMPVGLKTDRAVLLLSRAKSAGGFGPYDVDFARQ